MPDIYLTIDHQPRSVIESIRSSMETRAAEPAMQAICRDYMRGAGIQRGARILETGCGAGASARVALTNLDPARILGVDPSPGLIEAARDAFSDDARASFAVGEAARTGVEDGTFDAVLAHTVYSHLADSQAALVEAHRVLRPGGRLVVFDGDYATTTVALYDGDPLEAAVDAVRRNLVHAPYVMRRLPALAASAGFSDVATAAHGYVQSKDPKYLLSLLARGADAAAAAGEFGSELAEGFLREAERRVAEGRFYGAILFVSLVAQKPAD